jgi:hypothetical protein
MAAAAVQRPWGGDELGVTQEWGKPRERDARCRTGGQGSGDSFVQSQGLDLI